MTDFYKCSMCGKIVKVIAEGKGQVVCCDQPMTVLANFKSVQEILDFAIEKEEEARAVLPGMVEKAREQDPARAVRRLRRRGEQAQGEAAAGQERQHLQAVAQAGDRPEDRRLPGRHRPHPGHGLPGGADRGHAPRKGLVQVLQRPGGHGRRRSHARDLPGPGPGRGQAQAAPGDRVRKGDLHAKTETARRRRRRRGEVKQA